MKSIPKVQGYEDEVLRVLPIHSRGKGVRADNPFRVRNLVRNFSRVELRQMSYMVREFNNLKGKIILKIINHPLSEDGNLLISGSKKARNFTHSVESIRPLNQSELDLIPKIMEEKSRIFNTPEEIS